MSGDHLDLDAIEARIGREVDYCERFGVNMDYVLVPLPLGHMHALVAEVRRLREEVAGQAHRLDMAREFSFRVAEERLGITPPNLDAP